MTDPNMLDWTNFVIGAGILITTVVVLSLQLKRQTKATSANLSLEMLKRMRDDDFRDVVKQIFQNSPEKCDSNDLDRLLNHFEYMAIFESDGTLDIDHIKHIYRPVLLKIKESPYIQKIIQDRVEENPTYFYVYSRGLLNKIQ